jgi:hypothetical protein
MSTTYDRIFNGNGSKKVTRTGSWRRQNRIPIEFRGMRLLVDYDADGAYMPATDTDPAEYPICQVKSVEISAHGRSQSGEWVPVLIDATELLKDFEDEIASRVEQSWEQS